MIEGLARGMFLTTTDFINTPQKPLQTAIGWLRDTLLAFRRFCHLACRGIEQRIAGMSSGCNVPGDADLRCDRGTPNQ
jgi:hypothetical protein